MLDSVDPSLEIVSSSLSELLSTLSTMGTLDLASNIEIIHVTDDLIQLLKLSNRVSTLKLEGYSTRLLSSALAIQILYSRVPFCAHLKALIFRYLDVEAHNVLSFCQSLSGRLRKVEFVGCRFETLHIETQLLNDLRESGVEEVLSSDSSMQTPHRTLRFLLKLKLSNLR